MYQFLIRNGFQMKINMCTQNCSIWYYIFKTNNNIIHLKLKKAVKYLCCGCFFVVVVLLEKVGNLIQSLHNSDYTIEIRSTKYRKNIFLGFFLFRSTYQKSKVSRIIIHIKRYPRRSRIVYSCKPHWVLMYTLIGQKLTFRSSMYCHVVFCPLTWSAFLPPHLD